MYAHFKLFQVIIIYAGFSVRNLLATRQPANQETETQLSQSLQNVNFPTGQTTQYSCEKPKPALICRLFLK